MSFRYLLYYWIGRVLIKVFERRKRSFGNIKLNSYTYYSKILGGLLDGNNTYKCTNMVTILSWFCASDHPPVINCREINILNCPCAYGIKLPFFQDFSVLWTPWLLVKSSGYPYPLSLAKCAFDWSAWPTILVWHSLTLTKVPSASFSRPTLRCDASRRYSSNREYMKHTLLGKLCKRRTTQALDCIILHLNTPWDMFIKIMKWNIWFTIQHQEWYNLNV